VKRLFVLTPDARRDLKEIFLDIAEDSADTAERLRCEFRAGLQLLGRSPGIGHFHDELLSRKYRFWNFYSYVVAYVWESAPIQVIAVVHGARDLGVFFELRTSPESKDDLHR
jgi:plasmid stabilization system protein ParE